MGYDVIRGSLMNHIYLQHYFSECQDSRIRSEAVIKRTFNSI